MTPNDYAPPEELDIPPGEYQAVVRSTIKGRGIHADPETIVLFEITEPNPPTDAEPRSPGENQRGLGGRIARAWFQLGDENPATRGEAENRLDTLLWACDASTVEEAVGSVVRIRVARVVMRSDPSRHKSAVVFVQPIDYEPPGYVS
jgi:hypothetical protein